MSVCIESVVDDLLSKARQFAVRSDLIGVCEHTDDVMAGDIFVAVDKGVDFAHEALDKGAALVVYDACNRLMDSVPHERIIGVENFHGVVRLLVRRIYGCAVDSVSLIGITGTNGKTSTAGFVCQILNTLGRKTGYIGTLGFGVIGLSIVKSRNTTPDMVTLYRYIDILYRQGCEFIAIEVSSHSIALDRIYCLSFFVGIFTNLSRDHLDFHKSMKNYAMVKRSFFIDYKIDCLVVNFDDSTGRQIAEEWGGDKPILGFSAKHTAPDILKYYSHGMDADGENNMTIQYEGKIYELPLSIYGSFNAANMAAAITSCLALHYPIDDVIQAALSISPIPGRMQYFKTERQINVFIDYAHTPAGIQAVLTDESVISGDTWCVLGSGGERDPGKRAEMARMTGYASHVVICDDNVRRDSATRIVVDMLQGVQSKAGTVICRDRSQAIDYALSHAQQGDSLFLLGKGNEDYIDYEKCKIMQSDLDVVKQYSEIK